MKVFVEQIAFKRSTLHPVEFGAWLHLELVTIHPFIDGNGRTARLLMNMGLMQTGYVQLNIICSPTLHVIVIFNLS